jgi:hypothetical protein
MTSTKLKSTLLGMACATALATAPFTASAQVSGVALPIDGLTGLLGSVGGLGSLTSLGGGLGGLTSLGGGLGGLTGASGGLSGLTGLTDGLSILGQVTPLLNGVTGLVGIGLPDLTTGLLDGGLQTLSVLGLDIVDGVLSGGPGGIPLIGDEVAYLLTPEGLVSGVTGLLSLELPISLPVVGPHPVKLFGPVVVQILETQGLPLGDLPLPF